MRIVMMGTGPFALPTFHWLLQSDHTVPALVTRPPKPTRSRSKPVSNPIQEAAERAGVDVHMPKTINSPEAMEIVAALAPDLLVVCDYGQILSSEALGLARLGGINLHASMLPAYRGAAPINWAIYEGCQETGVSVIHMTPKLDGGPVLVANSTPIGREENAGQLEPRLAELGVHAVVESLRMLSQWDGESVIGKAQDPRQATRAPRLSKSDGAMDWSRTAIQIGQQVRAFQPWPGSYTFWRPHQSQPVRWALERTIVESSETSTEPPGSVLLARQDDLIVATGDGCLRLVELRPAGKRVMTAAEYLRGATVKPGDMLSIHDGHQ